jgi:hypothetical protein
MRQARLHVFAAGTAALCVVLTGCGTEVSASPGVSPETSPASIDCDRPTGAPTAGPTTPASPSVSVPSIPAASSPTPVADDASLRVIDRMEREAIAVGTATISSGGQQRGAVRWGPDPAATMTSTVSYQGRAAAVDFVVADGSAYAQVGEWCGRGDDVWIRLDQTAAPFAAALTPQVEAFLTTADLPRWADLLRASSVVEVGDTSALGVSPGKGWQATLYSVTTDSAVAAVLVDPLVSLSWASRLDAVPPSLRTGLAVDGEGPPRAFTVDGDAGPASLDWDRFGEPVTIVVPTEEQVVPFADVFGA